MKRVLAAAAVLLAAACGGGSSTPAGAGGGPVTATGPSSAQVAEVKGDPTLHFVPAEVRAKVGTLTLTLGNIGGTPHNLVFDDPSFPRIPIVSQGTASATLVLAHPGSYRFQCTIHAGMSGRLVVA